MSKKSILQKIIAAWARAIIYKYKPIIIGITGSVGKTSTRQAIFTVLKKKYHVRTADKNYNNEIGLPLTILGISHHGHNVFRWFYALCRVFFRVIVCRHKYPEVLILEYGIDHPGDMDYLLSIAKPNIAVVTSIGDIPVHVDFFKNPEELIAEKTKLVEALAEGGYAVLNHDDFAVYGMKEKTKAPAITFGFEEHADLKITNYKLRTVKDEKSGDVPEGLVFKIENGGDVVPIHLHGAFGIPQVYAATAAAAVGLVLNMNLVEVSRALEEYVLPPGRLRLLKGIKNSFILDDTYNAAPAAMRLALDTLKALPGKRKIAVLGDMLEIGKYSEQAHRAIGDQAAEFVDLLFCVGPRAKFIANEYRAKIGSRTDLRSVQIFDDSLGTGKALDAMIQGGDLILVKGSQALRMEKVVEEIMAFPQRAQELLVRQDSYWRQKPA